jgi:hypothetical protein
MDRFGELPSPRKENPNTPDRVYMNMKPVFASAVLTVPRLNVDLPENVTLNPDRNGLVVTLKNNGRYKVNPYDSNDVKGDNWDQHSDIEQVQWGEHNYSGQDIVTRRRELLEEFFKENLGGDENVSHMRHQLEQAGLGAGTHLYRAIKDSELRQLTREEGAKFISHLDPSANFESEAMFQGEHSQVKQYSGKKGDGYDDYSGHIIRWQLEDPLLYRTGGMGVPRVVPMFSHYLPAQLEISSDKGETFVPLGDFLQQRTSK